MSQFQIPEINQGLSERLFKDSKPIGTLGQFGYGISAVATTVVHWIGYTIKEFNSGIVRLEQKCIIEKTDALADKILKRLGDALAKLGVITFGVASYLCYGAVCLFDIVGIAFRTAGLPSDGNSGILVADRQGCLEVVLDHNMPSDSAESNDGITYTQIRIETPPPPPSTSSSSVPESGASK